MDCYIYFKAIEQHAAQVLECSSLMLQLLSEPSQLSAFSMQQAGLHFTLQRRPQVSNGLHTWMEIYRDLEPHQLQNFEQLLQHCVEQSGLQAYIAGNRHLEYFCPVSMNKSLNT